MVMCEEGVMCCDDVFCDCFDLFLKIFDDFVWCMVMGGVIVMIGLVFMVILFF